MYDLSNSGLALRTMKPKDLAQFSGDLNHNFMTILHAAGFKGMPGASIEGPAGIGIRGSKWFFVATRVSEFMSTYGLTSGAEVTIPFLNAAFNANQNLLAATVGLSATDAFVEGDMVVLTSGQVVQLDMIDDGTTITPTWVDTSVTFEQAIGLTEDAVHQIILEMIGSPSDAESIFRRFAAVAKNHSDASPGTNNAINNDSVIDIPTSDAGPGTVYPDHYIIAPKEQIIGLNTKLCLLAGSPQKYHALVQQTQEALTNQYAPGVDDFAAGIFLQSSYKNGIIMGHRDSGTIKEFMRMYKTSNALVIASHYSPNIEDYSEFQLSQSKILVRATNEVELRSNHLYFTGNKMTSKFFGFDGNAAYIAPTNPAYLLNIYAKAGIYLRHHQNKHFLSTDANGKIISPFTLITSMVGTLTHQQVVSALAIDTIVTQINNTLSDHEIRITELENAANELNFKDRGYVHAPATVHLNTYQTEGNYAFHKDAVIQAGPSIPSIQSGTTYTQPTILAYHLNVYKVESTVNNVAEVHQTLIVRTNNTVLGSVYRGDLEFFRFASGAAGSTTLSWSGWSRKISSLDNPKASNGLTYQGQLSNNNLVIKHANRSNTVPDIESFPDGVVVSNISTDDYGHPTRYWTKDLDNRYYTQAETYNQTEIDELLQSNMRIQSGIFSKTGGDHSINGGTWYLYPPTGYTMADFKGHIYSIIKIRYDGHGHKYNKTHAYQLIPTIESSRVKLYAAATGDVRKLDWSGIYSAEIQYLAIWSK